MIYCKLQEFMSKKKFYSLLAVTICLVGCGSKNENTPVKADSSAAFVDSSELILMDTIVSEEGNDTIKEIVQRFPTTESQLKYMKESENWSKYETGILPQMAEEVPSYCEKILQSKHKRFIIVDKAKMKLFLYDKYGNIEKSVGIACAKNYGTKQKKGDSRTTEGYFTAEGIYDSTNWLFTDDNGYTSPTRGVYGPKFIRLTTPYIGIHGTGSPGSIGKRCSHGCIRMTNDNILAITKLVEAGTPIIISPGPKDMAVNQHAGINMPSVTTEPGGTRAVPGSVDPSQYNVGTTTKKKQVETENIENQEGEIVTDPVEKASEGATENTPAETPKAAPVENTKSPATTEE